MGLFSKASFNLGDAGGIMKSLAPIASMIPVLGPVVGAALGVIGGVVEGMDAKVSYDKDNKRLDLDFASRDEAAKAKDELERSDALDRAGLALELGGDGRTLSIDDPQGMILKGALALPGKLAEALLGKGEGAGGGAATAAVAGATGAAGAADVTGSTAGARAADLLEPRGAAELRLRLADNLGLL